VTLIEVDDVTRTFNVHTKTGRFGRRRSVVTAVRELNFAVSEGEFVGYLGANGAGKSTTIKMLTGVLAPTSGRIRVDGHDPLRDRSVVAFRIGAMFGQRVQLWWDLPLVDSFEQLRYIYRVGATEFHRRLAELTSILELQSLLATPVRQLSLGQRIRGELAAAMIHAPDVLFLDEPTIGLDVIAKQRIRDFLITMNRKRGVTIMLTTHDMADLERMCTRLILLANGELVSDGSISELITAHKLERTMVVDLNEAYPPLTVPGVRVEKVDGPRQWLRFRSGEITPERLIAAVAGQAGITDLTINEPDVEDLVRLLHQQEFQG
jgi:ABC-2 type transport system ATP-binding protein